MWRSSRAHFSWSWVASITTVAIAVVKRNAKSMTSRTLSSEMVSQWTVQDVANWFSENGFGSAKKYIKQHKINGQKLLLHSSQPQKEMFGMNEKRTRELLSKLNTIGIYNNFPSDDSFDEIYQSSEDEDGGTDSTKDKCGYLNPDQCESQTDLSFGEFPPSTPPELPPRTALFSRMACEVLDNVPREFNSRESKNVKINEGSVIPPAVQKPFSSVLSLSEEDSGEDGSEYEPVDEVTDVIKTSLLKSISMQQNDSLPSKSTGWQTRNPLPKLPSPKHESDIPCKPSPNLPLSSPKHMSHQIQCQLPKLPPARKDSAIKEDESDGLEYEIGSESCKPPSPPPPRPKAIDPGFKAVDPEWQTNARFHQGTAPSLPSDHFPELITPTKFRHPCVPGMLKIEIDDITQKKSQLKPRNKEEVVISEKATCLKSPAPNILKPTKMKFATEEPMANGHVKRTPPVSRPLPEKPSVEKKAVLPLKNIPIRQTNPISISLEDEKWYHKIGRPEAGRILEAINKNGAFVVRPSSRDPQKPYVLVVYLDGEVKNIPIRKRSDKKFALGNEKTNEEAFESISKLVAYHFQKKIDILTKAGIRGVTLVNAQSLNK